VSVKVLPVAVGVVDLVLAVSAILAGLVAGSSLVFALGCKGLLIPKE
jgi:hypothetical protein